MTNRQIEKLADVSFDLGKLTYGSLVLGFFQLKTDPLFTLIVALWGLTISVVFTMIGLRLIKEIK